MLARIEGTTVDDSGDEKDGTDDVDRDVDSGSRPVDSLGVKELLVLWERDVPWGAVVDISTGFDKTEALVLSRDVIVKVEVEVVVRVEVKEDDVPAGEIVP